MSQLWAPLPTADIDWVDGLPYATAFEDIYFSADNGLQEAMHVFIEGNHLPERWRRLSEQEPAQFVIGETGFGTGLNFLLAWSVWNSIAPSHARLQVISCEKHPLSPSALQSCLALWPALSDYAAALIAAYPVLTPGYHRLEFQEGRVTLDLMLGDALICYQERLLCGDSVLEQALRQDYVNAWFLDGFSPQKNPEMWSDALFETLSLLSTTGTTLSTFSAAGSVKRGLRAAGFDVHQQPGYGQKRDMTVAVWQQSLACRIKARTPWHVPSFRQPIKPQQAIVVGAGLAGCCVAEALARRGLQVRVLDSQATLAAGASGNQQAIVFPNISPYQSPFTAWMLAAFLYAVRFYQQCNERGVMGDFQGILQFIAEGKTAQAQADLARWLLAYPKLGRMVNAQLASELSGVEVTSGGLWIPLSGWVDAPALCAQLMQHPNIQFLPNTDVQDIALDAKGCWHVAGHDAEVVILANGYQANAYPQTFHLDIQAVPGQMTSIQASLSSSALKIPLCGSGHIAPHVNGIHMIGATFGMHSAHDDEMNLANITHLPAHLNVSNNIVSHWSGIRATTRDHLPLVGPVANASLFTKTLALLGRDPNRFIASGGEYVHGLYIAAGFGSRGLTSIPLCADYLASLINHEPSPLPQHLVKAISPARFLYRGMLREVAYR